MKRRTPTVQRLKTFGEDLILFYVPLTLIAGLILFPFYWLIVTSLRPTLEMFRTPVQYVPQDLTLEHYSLLGRLFGFRGYFRNSLVVALITCGASLIVALPAAYALARFQFTGKAVIRLSFLVTYLFPPVLVLVPLFEVMRGLRLINTYWGLALAYTTYTLPFALWMLIGFFLTVPSELEDAALVDGCTRLGALVRVLLPVILPGVVATTIFVFVYSWNEYLLALMFTSGPSMRTLPVGLALFMVHDVKPQWGAISAASAVASLPAAIMFLFVQKYLVKGLTAGAMKG
jgi:multiple sugar transport system permease protein